MSEKANGRVVVIAGGTRGIGLSITRQFASIGDKVVVGARQNRPELDALAAVEFVTADMTQPEGPGQLVGTALERYWPRRCLDQ